MLVRIEAVEHRLVSSVLRLISKFGRFECGSHRAGRAVPVPVSALAGQQCYRFPETQVVLPQTPVIPTQRWVLHGDALA